MKPFTIFGLTLCILAAFGGHAQNRLHSRLFYQRPPFHNSPSRATVSFANYGLHVMLPIDDRAKYYGEPVYKNKNVEHYDDFFGLPAMVEIQNKIEKDLAAHGMNGGTRQIQIVPTVEVFYPDVRGFLWVKSFAKVRLSIKAMEGDNLLIDKKYESFYITNGTDKEYEGQMVTTIEQGANITLGMTLRKALDIFYRDLYTNLTK